MKRREERRRISQEERRKQVHHVGIHAKDFLLVPNLLSMSRLLFAMPAVYLIVMSDSESNDLTAVALLFASFITDMLDGIWARTFHSISDLGKILDPVIDKIVVITVSFALALGNRDPQLPIWMLGAVVVRDAIILLLARRVLHEDHHLFVSSWTGKAATFVIAFTLLSYLLNDYLPEGLLTVLPYISVGLLVLSSIDYFEKYWSVRHKRYQ